MMKNNSAQAGAQHDPPPPNMALQYANDRAKLTVCRNVFGGISRIAAMQAQARNRISRVKCPIASLIVQ